jgi:hypothetical protein
MKQLLIVGMLIVLIAPLFAQAQRDPAKLKADAQRVVSAIRGDKAKSQAYCQINSLGGEIDLAAQAKDEQKADALTKKINDLEKQLGPEYIALFDALDKADSHSKDFQDILSLFDNLDNLSALIGHRKRASPTKCARSISGERLANDYDGPRRRERRLTLSEKGFCRQRREMWCFDSASSWTCLINALQSITPCCISRVMYADGT